MMTQCGDRVPPLTKLCPWTTLSAGTRPRPAKCPMARQDPAMSHIHIAEKIIEATGAIVGRATQGLKDPQPLRTQ